MVLWTRVANTVTLWGKNIFYLKSNFIWIWHLLKNSLKITSKLHKSPQILQEKNSGNTENISGRSHFKQSFRLFKLSQQLPFSLKICHSVICTMQYQNNKLEWSSNQFVCYWVIALIISVKKLEGTLREFFFKKVPDIPHSRTRRCFLWILLRAIATEW